MTTLDPQVLQGILALLERGAAATGSSPGEIGPQTGSSPTSASSRWRSSILSTMVQQQYGRLPFPQFFEEIGQRPVEERDLTVAELAMFVCEHRKPSRAGGVKWARRC